MSESSILGPTARPFVQLGGANAWKTRVIKGVHCSFQWIDLRKWGFEDTPDHAAVACMCLFRPSSMESVPYVIPQPQAFLFGDNKGNPTAHLFTSAAAALEGLGYDVRDKAAWKAMVDIIIEGLPDLILMPSEPPENSDVIVKKAVMGIEMRATMNGKVLREEVL
jgi:hypothetical protein